MKPRQRESYLRRHGYDGLWCGDNVDNCGCSLDNLYPCEEGPGEDCVPGHRGRDGLMYRGKRKEAKA